MLLEKKKNLFKKIREDINEWIINYNLILIIYFKILYYRKAYFIYNKL